MIGTKNLPLSAAAQDLGIGAGDALQNQVDAELAERKKKLLSAANSAPPAGVASGAVGQQMGALSPMSLGLMGNS